MTNAKPDPMAEDELDKLLRSTWAYSVDWTKYSEKQETGDNDVTLYAAKIKKEMREKLKAAINAYTTNKIIEELDKLHDRFYDPKYEDSIITVRIAELRKTL